MGRFGQILNLIGLLNGAMVGTFGLLYMNGGQISRDEFIGWFMLVMGAFYIVGYIILFALKIRNSRREVKALASK